MSNDLWRWADPDGQQRRVRLDELRAALAGGHIAPNTPVWRAGWIGWQSAHEVPELQSSALSAANGVVPNIPPPPLAMVAMQHEFEAKAGSSFSQPPLSLGPHGQPDGAFSEPPPPPHYVAVAVKASIIPPGPSSSGRLPSIGPRSPVSSPMGGTPAAPNVDPRGHAQGTGPHAPSHVPMGLPTTVGLPPPPELMAMVDAQRAALGTGTSPTAFGATLQAPNGVNVPGSAAMPTGSGAPSGPSSASGSGVEELSGSALLDDVSSRHDLGAANGLPPPTNPVLRGADGPNATGYGDDNLLEDAGLPPRRRPQLTAIFDDLNEIKAGRPPKNKLLLGVIAFVALMVFVSLLALVVGAIRGKPSELPTARTSGSGSAMAAAAAAPSETPADPASDGSVPPPAEVASAAVEEPKPVATTTTEGALGDCAVAGDAHVVYPHAFVPSGVEAVPVPGAIALGFATDPRNGLGFTVDPGSIGITTTVKARAYGSDARRMSPVLEHGKLTLVPDVDKKIDRLQARRVVGTNPAIDVGIAENAVVWAPHGQNGYAKLFPLDGDGAVDAIRAVPLAGTKGIAIAMRRGNSVMIGIAKGDAALTPEGSLAHIAGLGMVGSPTITTSGDTIVVAWSDRATAQEPWQVRWTKLTAGGVPDAPKVLPLPEGGLGTQSMSPSVAGLGGGRFVIAWSEGTPSHQVRAQTMAADGSPSGSALALSAAGVNAGQPQVAVGVDGRGVVAFLAAKGKAFEIHATPVSCAAK